jgi:PhnB protein
VPFQQGSNFSVSVDCESVQEIDQLLQTVGEGGQVTMDLEHSFWGARFGMLRDRFGVNWILDYEYPKEA